MADSRKIIRIFLASPGDLKDERRSANSVVDKFNRNWAAHLGYQVELVGWEDTVSVFGRPQATINRDLERCEYFIGLMWQRWGTPPDICGRYTSGFEEEFETSIDRRKSTGFPEISLLFKEVEQDRINDPGDELKKVLNFKRRIITDKEVLFETFRGLEEFEEKFERCIIRYIQSLAASEPLDSIEKTEAKISTLESSDLTQDPEPSSESPFHKEGLHFLKNLIGRTESNTDGSGITSSEVARFRLLSAMIGERGNDDQHVGVHDANLLFDHRFELNLSCREQAALIDSGLDHYETENTPLWYWLTQAGAFDTTTLQSCSLFGTTNKRIGALSAMRLVSEPMILGGRFGRDRALESWFHKAAPSTLRVAALEYLATCGSELDLEIVQAEFNRADYRTRSAAVDAILRIKFRDSRDKAILVLCDLQPESVSARLLDAMFRNGDSISKKILLKCVEHQSSKVRRIAVKLLRKREELDLDVAEKCLADTDVVVRFEALHVVADEGTKLSEKEMKGVLVKPRPAGIFGFMDMPDSEETEYWERFRKSRMRSMKTSDLEEMDRNSTLFDFFARFVLYERQFSDRSKELRSAVKDRFKKKFDDQVSALARVLGDENEAVEKAKALEEPLRKEFTREGLDVICRRGGSDDLGLVRTSLESEFLSYSSADVKFLERFGDWRDVPLLVSLADRTTKGEETKGLLVRNEDYKFREISHAIYKLGRARLNEILDISMREELLKRIIVLASDRVFRDLSKDVLFSFFQSDRQTTRKVVAVKCVKALPKARIRDLLNHYEFNESYRYYNVIHWLDFGISMPRGRTRIAAVRVLSEEW